MPYLGGAHGGAHAGARGVVWEDRDAVAGDRDAHPNPSARTALRSQLRGPSRSVVGQSDQEARFRVERVGT